jgi:hypothetical protein
MPLDNFIIIPIFKEIKKRKHHAKNYPVIHSITIPTVSGSGTASNAKFPALARLGQNRQTA